MAHGRNSLTATTKNSSAYTLRTAQEPQQAKVYLQRDKDRKPLEPPPVIEILLDDNDPYKNFLSSPYYFMCVTLHENNKAETAQHSRNVDLAGTLVSSLHRVKDTENNDVGYFVFQDLSVRKEGEFRLEFSLFELQRGDEGMSASYIKSTLSKTFKVFSSAKCPPPLPSTFLTKHLQEQGVKLRTKKTQNPHGRRARRPEEWSSELPRQGNHASLLNRLPIPRSMADNYQNRFAASFTPNMYRRDAVRGLQTPSETNFSYNESTYGQSSFSSETNPYRQFNSRDEPPQKKRRRNPSFPDVDTRYVLGSHKVPSHGNGDDPTTPHSASVSFGDNYFSQQTMQDRPNESPSRGFIAQSSRQYGYNPSSQYLTPDSSRSYQGQFSNRFAMGTDLTAGFGGSTEPGRHHYTSSAESQNSVAAPTAMHPPVLGANRQSETTDSRYWQGSFENATYTPYHSRGSSSSAVPTGNLLPAPMNLQPRPSVENGMNSM